MRVQSCFIIWIIIYDCLLFIILKKLFMGLERLCVCSCQTFIGTSRMNFHEVSSGLGSLCSPCSQSMSMIPKIILCFQGPVAATGMALFSFAFHFSSSLQACYLSIPH